MESSERFSNIKLTGKASRDDCEQCELSNMNVRHTAPRVLDRGDGAPLRDWTSDIAYLTFPDLEGESYTLVSGCRHTNFVVAQGLERKNDDTDKIVAISKSLGFVDSWQMDNDLCRGRAANNRLEKVISGRVKRTVPHESYMNPAESMISMIRRLARRLPGPAYASRFKMMHAATIHNHSPGPRGEEPPAFKANGGKIIDTLGLAFGEGVVVRKAASKIADKSDKTGEIGIFIGVETSLQSIGHISGILLVLRISNGQVSRVRNWKLAKTDWKYPWKKMAEDSMDDLGKNIVGLRVSVCVKKKIRIDATVIAYRDREALIRTDDRCTVILPAKEVMSHILADQSSDIKIREDEEDGEAFIGAIRAFEERRAAIQPQHVYSIVLPNTGEVVKFPASTDIRFLVEDDELSLFTAVNAITDVPVEGEEQATRSPTDREAMNPEYVHHEKILRSKEAELRTLLETPRGGDGPTIKVSNLHETRQHGALRVRPRWIHTAVEEERSKSRLAVDPTSQHFSYDKTKFNRAETPPLATILVHLALSTGKEAEVIDVVRAYTRANTPEQFKNRCYFEVDGVIYMVIGALYGLYWAAMLWWNTFAETLKGIEWVGPTGEKTQLVPSASCPAVFHPGPKDIGTGEAVQDGDHGGAVITYADDIFVGMGTQNNNACIAAVEGQFDIRRSKDSNTLVFCGYEIVTLPDGSRKISCRALQMDLERTLAGMGVLRPESDPMHKNMEHRSTKGVLDNTLTLKQYQSILGKVMAISARIAPIIAVAARVASTNTFDRDRKANDSLLHLANYTACTGMSFVYKPIDRDRALVISAYCDSNYPPFGRVRVGSVIFIEQSLVQFQTINIKLVATSPAVAEVYAILKAVVALLRVMRDVVAAQRIIAYPVKVYCDNRTAVEECSKEGSGKSTRHINVAVKLITVLRDRGIIELSDIASANNLADPMTKLLGRTALQRHTAALGVE